MIGCHTVTQLTPWCVVLLKKLVKKFSTIHKTHRLITMFTRAHHFPILSQMYSVHTFPPNFPNIHPGITSITQNFNKMHMNLINMTQTT